MALGTIIFSMPIALLGSLFVTALNGFDTTQALAAYSVFGAVFLLALSFKLGLAKD